MLLSTQTGGVVPRFGFEKGVEILHDAGYDCLDYSLFKMILDDNALVQDNWREVVEGRRRFCDERGIVFNQSHAPYAFRWADAEVREKIANPRVERSIIISAMMGAKIVVVHPLHYFEFKGHEEEAKQMNLDYYRSLIPLARDCGIKIGLENMWQKETKRKCISFDVASTAADLADYIDRIDSEWVVACLDVGHSSLIGEEAQDAIRFLGRDRLKALQVHDNSYTGDDHMLPGIGRMDWDEIMKALKDIGYTGEFTYEADAFLRNFSDDFIPTAVKFMEQTGRYLLAKIE